MTGIKGYYDTGKVGGRFSPTSASGYQSYRVISSCDVEVSPGLVQRLVRYAIQRFAECGFDVSAWAVELEVYDADRKPSERTYTVTFTNEKGGGLELNGIYTQHGHPFLDHGMNVKRPSL